MSRAPVAAMLSGMNPLQYTELLLARATKAGCRRGLTSFETAGRCRVPGRLSALAAAATARRALREVPAYAEFVAAYRGSRPRGRGWFEDLPVTDKANYIDRYSLPARCRGGVIPAYDVELDESAGSSGRPYTWARSATELHEVHQTMALLCRHLLTDAPRDLPVVALNGFSMGAWATGTSVARALARVGVVKSTGPEPDQMLATMRELGPRAVWVVTGYPPFLRRFLDHAEAAGVDLSDYPMYGFVGGEGMSETLRARLERTFRAVYSAYGASDLDIGVAAELPFSVWLRQQAATRPELARALFGTTERLPMVFQYDPTDYHVETIGGELVVTVCRRSLLSPRIRYNIHDSGGSLAYSHVVEVCRDFGLDPALGALSRSSAPVLRLPLLYVHGRSDSTVSVHGANIYPEDVEWGLGESADADAVLGYALDTGEDAAGVIRPLVHVECPDPTDHSLADRLSRTVLDRLLANSADFRTAVAEDRHTGEIEVRLHPPGGGPFAVNAGRIKRRYVLAGAR